ncbi:MAG: GC-type dockerin domain-anchored protein [Planctomycetota bacterium]
MVLRFKPVRPGSHDYRDGKRRRTVAVAAAALSLGVASQLTRAQWDDPPAALPASDGANSDEYGFSVDVAGDVAIVGAPYHDALGQDAGAAYICRSTAGVWQEEKKLLPPDGTASDQFGYAVAVSGDFAVVGAYNHAGHGAAYVYRFNGSTWSYRQTLEPSDLGNGDSFGWDLEISGDVIFVGANLHHNYAGAVYVYRYNGASWTQEQKINAPAGAANFFGTSVAVWEDVAVIGNNLNAVNGPGSGAAYVFRDNGTTWVGEQMIFPADGGTNQKFSMALDVFGDVIVASAPGDDDNGAGSGSAYVFRFGGHAWSQEAKLLASDGLGGDQFGTAVSVSGGLIAVGAPARAVHDPFWMPSYGASYVFRHTGGAWSQETILLDPEGWLSDEAGKAVSVSGNTVLMGIPLADGAGVDAGKAIVFEGEDVVVPDCMADINGDGVVDVSDFLDLLAEWDAAGGPADINGDGIVDVADFLDLLAEWGPCP